MVYNGYYKVMSNIPKMGQLPTPVKPTALLSNLPSPPSPLTDLATRLVIFARLPIFAAVRLVVPGDLVGGNDQQEPVSKND